MCKVMWWSRETIYGGCRLWWQSPNYCYQWKYKSGNHGTIVADEMQ